MKDKSWEIYFLLFITGLLTNLELTMTLMIAQQNEDEIRPSGSSVSYLACDCPEGYYAKGTMKIFITTNICLQSQLPLEEQFKEKKDNSLFKRPTTFPSLIQKDFIKVKQKRRASLIPVTMKICESCATGCGLCLGPDENDCLQCLAEYLRIYDDQMTSVTEEVTLNIAESTTATLLRQKRTTGHQNVGGDGHKKKTTVATSNKDIYEEEGLLATDYHQQQHASTPIKNKKRGDPKLNKYSKSSRTSGKVDGKINNEDSQFDVDDNFMTFEADGSSGYIEKEYVNIKPPKSNKANDKGDVEDEDEEGEEGRVTGHMSPVKRNKNFHKLGTPLDENIDFDVVDYYGDPEVDSNINFAKKFNKNDKEVKTSPKLKIESMVGSGEDVTIKASTVTYNDASTLATTTTTFDKTDPTTLTETITFGRSNVGTNGTGSSMPTTTTTTMTNAIQWKESSPFSCVSECPFGFYAMDNRVCQVCHMECNGCLDSGTDNCLECRHFEQDGHCVPYCQFNSTEWIHLWNASSSNCSIGVQQTREEIIAEIPTSYYAVPPLVILGGLLFMLLSYFRRRYRLQLNWPCTKNGRACRNNNQDHEDHKKCFLNRPKQTNQMATLKLPNEQHMKRPGNAYVFTEKHLPTQKRFTFHSGHSAGHHSTWPHTHKEAEDDFYELDPLYETPDSPLNRDGIRRMYPPYYRRRSSASTQCYLTPSNMQQIRGIPQISVNDHHVATKHSEYGHNTPEMPVRKKRLNSEAEVPKFEAPPLPFRSSSLENDDDHIYVNIDEER